MTTQNLKQFNIELLRLQQRHLTEQQLLNTSKHLVSRSLNLAIENPSFREALSSFIVRSIKGGK